MRNLALATISALSMAQISNAATLRFYYVTTDSWVESAAPPEDEYYFYDENGPYVSAKFTIEVGYIYPNSIYSSDSQRAYGTGANNSYVVSAYYPDVKDSEFYFNSRPVKYGFSTDSTGNISNIFLSYGRYYDDLSMSKNFAYFWYDQDIAQTNGYWVMTNLSAIPSTVPVPATAPLLLAGTALLAGLRRRKVVKSYQVS